MNGNHRFSVVEYGERRAARTAIREANNPTPKMLRKALGLEKKHPQQ